MKIIYVGRSDSLASFVIDQLTKEGHSVTILDKKPFLKGLAPKLRYKRYSMEPDGLGLTKVFLSIRPDAVVFTGANCEAPVWEYNQETSFGANVEVVKDIMETDTVRFQSDGRVLTVIEETNEAGQRVSAAA